MQNIIKTIQGIERFAVPKGHPAYNRHVGILFDDLNGEVKLKIKEAIKNKQKIYFINKNNNRIKKHLNLLRH